MVKKAFGMPAFIGKDIEYKHWNIVMQLHNSLMKPHLENCVHFGAAS